MQELLEAIAEFRSAFVVAVGDTSPFARIALERLDAAVATVKAGPGIGYRWLAPNEFIHAGDEWLDEDNTWHMATRDGFVVTWNEWHLYRRHE